MTTTLTTLEVDGSVFVPMSDYQALQAEVERLRELTARLTLESVGVKIYDDDQKHYADWLLAQIKTRNDQDSAFKDAEGFAIVEKCEFVGLPNFGQTANGFEGPNCTISTIAGKPRVFLKGLRILGPDYRDTRAEAAESALATLRARAKAVFDYDWSEDCDEDADRAMTNLRTLLDSEP